MSSFEIVPLVEPGTNNSACQPWPALKLEMTKQMMVNPSDENALCRAPDGMTESEQLPFLG
jgi:hypothetical protein